MNIDKFFDAILRADTINQAKIEVSNLKSQLAQLGKQCGDCAFWMNNYKCPKEKLVNGFWKGPSCAETICPLYQESESTTKRRESIKAEIEEKKESLKNLISMGLTTQPT